MFMSSSFGQSLSRSLNYSDSWNQAPIRFSVRGPEGDLGEFHLNVPGFHNVLNATAALAIGLELGVDVEKARQALDAYSGVDRRFQKRGEAGGVTVVDDYGHHPRRFERRSRPPGCAITSACW